MAVRSSSRRRGGALLLVAVLAAGAVSGCSERPGAAAVVDGEQISVAELQDATVDLAPYLQNVTQSSVLMVLVVAPTFERAAIEAGVAVSEQQARDLLEQAETDAAEAGTTAARTSTFSAAAVEVAKFTLIQSALNALPDAAAVANAVSEELGALDATINPRYGTVDFTTGSIVPTSYPWLVASPPAA